MKKQISFRCPHCGLKTTHTLNELYKLNQYRICHRCGEDNYIGDRI